MIKKKIVFINMGGFLDDLKKETYSFFDQHPHLKERFDGYVEYIHGIFRHPSLIDKPIESIYGLNDSGRCDLFIETTSPRENPDAARYKRFWIDRKSGTNIEYPTWVSTLKYLL